MLLSFWKTYHDFRNNNHQNICTKYWKQKTMHKKWSQQHKIIGSIQNINHMQLFLKKRECTKNTNINCVQCVQIKTFSGWILAVILVPPSPHLFLIKECQSNSCVLVIFTCFGKSLYIFEYHSIKTRQMSLDISANFYHRFYFKKILQGRNVVVVFKVLYGHFYENE